MLYMYNKKQLARKHEFVWYTPSKKKSHTYQSVCCINIDAYSSVLYIPHEFMWEHA